MKLSQVLPFVALFLACNVKNNNTPKAEIKKETDLSKWKFSIREMENLVSIPLVNFETEVITKGYSPQEQHSSSIYKLYLSDSIHKNGKQDQISWTKIKDIHFVTFSTTNKQDYISFKNSLIGAGYIFKGQGELSDSNSSFEVTSFSYSNNEFTIGLSSDYRNGETWFDYRVSKK